MTLSSQQIRSSFLEFFGKRGHEVLASAPLIPQNDPTLMFTNAGMVPFKDVFTGVESRPYRRAASSQKCIRISGKHNDLENVGVTARHHTFFEMLGNFSFGDYFKEEAIVNAWELLHKEFQLPAERLVVTVFGGEGGFAADDEAAALWKKVAGLPDERIIRLGMADNFWTMGDTGPCGPCSEIHYFHGTEPSLSAFGQEPGADGSGWMEIWNLVFMQFNRDAKDAPATLLPAPSIDTGMGLERIASVLQGKTSNYDTDLLRALVDQAASIAQKVYGASGAPDDVSMRVIADHARTTTFLMAEGVMPDKQRREYVLRRVMRRAIRHGHRLGIERPFLHEVCDRVVDLMGDAYPELRQRRELIVRTTEDEEVRFRQTLKRGTKILEEALEGLRVQQQTVLGGEAAADLYTTYGFPLDLTEVMVREAGFGVDLVGAEKVIHGADEVSGQIDPKAAVSGIYKALSQELGTTKFVGYERETAESRVAAILVDGARVEVATAPCDVEFATEETPFYAESGGQVGDGGAAKSASGAALGISDTVRPVGGLVVHRARLGEGVLRQGDVVSLVVDHAARSATRRNHSATHLLHWALRQVLGEHAQQKGSRVGPEILRFDFSHNQPLTQDQIERIETLVNEKILTNAPVLTEVLPMDKARAKGAMAIFEEKYGDMVRVLTMTPDCVELCGGTHARALGDIGSFTITGEGGVASGVRRLTAATGINAVRHMQESTRTLLAARETVMAKGTPLVERLEKLVQHEKELEKKIGVLERRLLEAVSAPAGDGAADEGVDVRGVRVLCKRVADGASSAALRELAEKLRDKLGERSAVLLGALVGDKAQLVLMLSKAATETLRAGDLIKPVAEAVGGTGGGRPDMAQAGGTIVAGLDEAFARLPKEIERVLAAASLPS